MVNLFLVGTEDGKSQKPRSTVSGHNAKWPVPVSGTKMLSEWIYTYSVDTITKSAKIRFTSKLGRKMKNYETVEICSSKTAFKHTGSVTASSIGRKNWTFISEPFGYLFFS